MRFSWSFIHIYFDRKGLAENILLSSRPTDPGGLGRWLGNWPRNPKHWCSSGLSQRIASVFARARAPIPILQLLNSLDRFLSVLHASCSVFSKGHLFLRNHGFCLKICFCDLFIFLLNVFFFFSNCQYLQHSERTKSGCRLTEEGCVHEKWRQECQRRFIKMAHLLLQNGHVHDFIE